MKSQKKKEPTDPIKDKNDVQESNDPKIDEDVPGFPHSPSSHEDIKKKNPTSKAHKK